jgi:serine/threonine protein kinase/WD40 repeat protein/tetratricopeptide (TPR) repeat protein
MAAMNPSSGPEVDALDVVVEAILQRCRQGERPALSEYTGRYPELAGRLREVFPALVMIEGLGSVDGVHTLAPAPRAPARVPERLGDYRLLREIGHGGMGIVYEAVQESLGRHVALKVLPAAISQRGLFLERFRREAKAAARLHHTNIVPVYGVGEEDCTCYYAMQFIQGQGLDAVLEDVKRLRGLSAGPTDAPTRTAGVSSGSVAGSLLAGHFAGAPVGAAAGPAAGPQALPAPTEESYSSLSGQPEARFFRSVARLGLQAAEALAHAHAQGVLHRDIKPSKLLLDTQGTLWITDFGLAKAEDSGDLTGTGDIVGTVRYMALERFEGKADARSDVYALGVTLYELLALRPPFRDGDRVALIGQITHDTPPPPRRFAPLLPRDLETIVLKAMARDRAARYATAGDLADDLRRFLENRPIKARRASVAERFRRWCRRNPAVAALTFAVFLLLASLAAGSTVAAIWLNSEREAAVTARNQLRDEEEQKTEKLYQSYVDQARASHLSRQVGQRFASLEAIRKAVAIARQRNMSAKRFGELRNLAIASLILPDLRVLREWEGCPQGTFQWDCDDQHRLYARNDLHGHVSVRRLSDDQEIAKLTTLPGESWLTFSPGGRFLAAWSHDSLRIWDLSRKQFPVVLELKPVIAVVAFHPGGRDVVVIQPDGRMLRFDLASAPQQPRLVARFPKNTGGATFDPDGKKLAVNYRGAIRFLDAETGKLSADLPERDPIGNIAWHPRGNFLAVVCGSRSIHVWDLIRRKQVATLEGCRSAGISAAFTPDGELLMSEGWEGKLRFWNWRTGQQVLHHPGGTKFRFGPRGHLIIAEGTHLKIVEVVTGLEYRSLVQQSSRLKEVDYGGCAVHSNGRLLAANMTDGARLWDLETGDELALFGTRGTNSLAFAGPDLLLTHSRAGLLLWPIRASGAEGNQRRIGPPRYLKSGSRGVIRCSADGKIVAQAGFYDGVVVMDRARPERPLRYLAQLDARGTWLSPDGRYVVTGTHGGLEAPKIWDIKTGHLVTQVRPPYEIREVVSPEGKWLAVTKTNGDYVVPLGTWGKKRPEGALSRGFSAGCPLLAMASGKGVIVLLDPATGREKARLEDPNQDSGILAFTPDGSRLVASSDDAKAIHVWDLRRIRRQLADIDLDWDAPPFPAADSPRKRGPLEVTVVGADLARNPQALLEHDLQRHTARLFLNPFDAEAYYHRGVVYTWMNKPDKALTEFNLALALRPDDADALFQRAYLYCRQYRWQAARDDLSRFLRQQPKDARARNQRGVCFFYLKDYPRALADLQESVRLNDSDAFVRRNLARVYVGAAEQFRNPKKALALIEKAKQLAPDMPMIWHTLGVTRYRLGRWKEAIAALEQSARLQGQPTAYELYFLAMCRHRLGDLAGARRDYEQALSWQEQQKAKLPVHQIEKLQTFRAAAEKLLKDKRP